MGVVQVVVVAAPVVLVVAASALLDRLLPLIAQPVTVTAAATSKSISLPLRRLLEPKFIKVCPLFLMRPHKGREVSAIIQASLEQM
jgi:hypothetical protein